MRGTMLGAVMACAILVPGAPLEAHHSFSAGFNMEDRFTTTGTLSKIAWLNPHIEIWLEVGEGDDVEAWRFEGMPPGFFRQRGIDKDPNCGRSGPPGDRGGLPFAGRVAVRPDPGSHVRGWQVRGAHPGGPSLLGGNIPQPGGSQGLGARPQTLQSPGRIHWGFGPSDPCSGGNPLERENHLKNTPDSLG